MTLVPLKAFQVWFVKKTLHTMVKIVKMQKTFPDFSFLRAAILQLEISKVLVLRG